ncbi:Clp protease N-terminal domain-containing protein [uncultured Aquimarina sp.]|uniref:Clp protease N-terminal domain-containing protein n=1 Tax=uncultured Aquimarina sp. TaxID=575652 RepID=UPI002625AF01|nr:Clp protease N-terminal domain-containing protein [uncultured Aquimarina sp.]
MKFNKELDEIVKNSRKIAIESGWNYISSYHFLLAMLKSENLPHSIFKNKEWKFKHLSGSIIKEKNDVVAEKYYLTKELETTLKNAKYYSWTYGESEVKPEHIIFAMLPDKNSDAGKYLISVGMDYSEFKFECEKIKKLKAKKIFEYFGKKSLTVKIGIPKLINSFIKNVA